MTSPLQARLAAELDPAVKGRAGLSRLNLFILTVILASVVTGILMTEPVLLARYPGVFLAAEIVFFVIFLAEYLARLWCAPLSPQRGSRLAFALSPPALIDLLVLVTMVLPIFGLEATILRFIRAVRILRLARLGRFSIALHDFSTAISERGFELMVGVGAAFVLLLIAATGLYVAEGGVQPEAFGSIPRALWWGVATLTTVGYGDVVPITGLGRVLAAITALCGVAVIAIPTGIIAAAFTEVIQTGKERRRAERDADEES